MANRYVSLDKRKLVNLTVFLQPFMISLDYTAVHNSMSGIHSNHYLCGLHIQLGPNAVYV